MNTYNFKSLIAALFLILATSSINAETNFTPSQPRSEKISNADYYVISSEGELIWFAQKVNSGSKSINARLEKDLDLKGFDWQPIGTGKISNPDRSNLNVSADKPYSGTFDGQFHVIRNISINQKEERPAGFFGYIDNAKIYRLGIESGNISSIYNIVGGIVGYAASTKNVIEDCYNKVNIYSSFNKKIYADNSTKINVNCGGIAGQFRGGEITRCFNWGNIGDSARDKEDQRNGGLVSWIETTKMTDCYNIGAVYGDNSTSFVRTNNTNTTVTNCYYADTTSVNTSNYIKNQPTPRNQIYMRTPDFRDELNQKKNNGNGADKKGNWCITTASTGEFNYPTLKSFESKNNPAAIVETEKYYIIKYYNNKAVYEGSKSKFTTFTDDSATLTAVDFTNAGNSTINVNISNTNCIIYSFQKNVKIAGACKNLVIMDINKTVGTIDEMELTDAYSFFCPYKLTAKYITYVRSFKDMPCTQSSGWQTIALPFTPTSIEAINAKDELVSLKPFGAVLGDSKPFWLRSLNEDGTSGFVKSPEFKANKPYIIAVPNSPSYSAEYNIPGDVTFVGENVTVCSLYEPGFDMFTSFDMTYTDCEKESTDYEYGLNDEGSAFEFNSAKTIKTFEGYIKPKTAGAPRFAINGSTNVSTDIEELKMRKDSSIDDNMYSLNGNLYIKSEVRKEISIFAVDGRKVSSYIVEEGENQISNLNKGLYIINGKKIII